MKKTIILAAILAGAILGGSSASAFNITGQSCAVIGGNCTNLTDDGRLSGDAPLVADVFAVVLTIFGGIAVIMLIVGGLRYITSQGDSSKMTQAKNTILYAVIGVVVALLGFGILEYVVNAIT